MSTTASASAPASAPPSAAAVEAFLPPTRGRLTIRSNDSNGGRPTTRSRSKSLSRKAKKAGSKLRGMVKSGMKSLRGVNGTSNGSRDGSGNDSRDSSVNGSTLGDGGGGGGGVQVDVSTSTREASTNSTASGSLSTSLDLVVLLMDPTSRRFELLQLEFDSPKAKVSDLLAQIPQSVTEDALKDTVQFVGVLDHRGSVQEGSTRLLDAFEKEPTTTTTTCMGGPSKLIVVAKPKGVSAKETVRLARPILTDKQVVKMLSSTGFDVTGWKSLKKSSSSSKVKSNGGTSTVTVSTARSAPLFPEAPVSSPTTTAAADAAAASSPSTAAAADAASSSNTKPNETAVDGTSLLSTLLLVAVVFAAISLQTIQNVWTRPIPVDVLLPIGTYKSKCGIVGMLPRSLLDSVGGVVSTVMQSKENDDNSSSILTCQNEYLQISYGYNDRKQKVKVVTATLYNAKGEVDVILTGHACPDDGDDDVGCTDGLVLDGNTKELQMAGRPLKSATLYHHEGRPRSDTSRILSPWPFVDMPRQKLKVRPFHKNNNKNVVQD